MGRRMRSKDMKGDGRGGFPVVEKMRTFHIKEKEEEKARCV